MATVTVRPNGAGALTTYTPVGAGTNWECVDESSADGDTTFVRINTGETVGETYTVGSSGLSAGDTINSVTIYATAKEFGSDDSFYFAADGGEGLEQLNSVTVTDSYVEYSSDVMTAIPNTGGVDPWTLAALNALEIGTVPNTVNIVIRITQIFAVIDYTAGPAGRSWATVIG